MSRCALVWLAILIQFSSNISWAQADMGANAQFVNAAKGICSGTGVATDVAFDATGNASVPLAKSGLSGTAHFSRSQWDGIVAMQKDPSQYVECLKTVIPF